MSQSRREDNPSSRPGFCENLYVALDAMKDRDDAYNKIRINSLRKIEQGFINRVLDDYPAMLSRYDLYRLRNRYIDILRFIPKEDISDEYQIIGNNDLKKTIDRLMLDIARIGAGELLGRDGKINDELFTFLKLDRANFLPKFQGHEYDLISSYVCTTFQQLGYMAKAYKDDLYGDAYSALVQYLTDGERLRVMINKGMEIANRKISLRDPTAEMHMKMYFPIEHPEHPAVITGVTTIAAASVAGLVYGAISLFSKAFSNSGPSLPQDPTFGLK